MKIETMQDQDLLSLLSEKGNLCISIILSTHKTSPDRRVDKLNAKKTMENTEQLLKVNYSSDITTPLIGRLTARFQQIDFEHNEEGIGLFVSSNISLCISFPFPVDEKIVVGSSFEIRDVLYKLVYAESYHALLLSKYNIRLFEGSWALLSEIKDNFFPAKYKEEYVYAPPSHSMSYAGDAHVKGFEKDKSQLEAIRFGNFISKVDKILHKYLPENEPLILIGTQKTTALFENSSSHKKSITGKITGSYNRLNTKQLSALILPITLNYIQRKNTAVIREFVEKISLNLATYGIRDIWKAAVEGKVSKLIIEKDFRRPGFLNGKSDLYLNAPKKPYVVLADAVDDLIEVVLAKGGNVFFVANGLLKDYKKAAAIHRY